MPNKQLIGEGAEAKVFLSGNTVIKERVPKSYRHPSLDLVIRRRRTKSEVKVLSKALVGGCNVPRVLSSDMFVLELEFVVGDKLSDFLNGYDRVKQLEVMRAVGVQVSLLHDLDLIHGDLTTSNMILSSGGEVFIIDFGLGFVSRRFEDKAVDLHLIKQALNAKHFLNHEELFDAFLSGYNPSDKEKVLLRLSAVEKRGRYRH